MLSATSRRVLPSVLASIPQTPQTPPTTATSMQPSVPAFIPSTSQTPPTSVTRPETPSVSKEPIEKLAGFFDPFNRQKRNINSKQYYLL